MADLTKAGKPSPVSLLIPANDKITGLKVGEDIAAGDACYIKSADGLIYRSNGTALNAAADVVGFAPISAVFAQGDALTLIANTVWSYGSGLTPGAKYYASTNAGQLSTTATTGGLKPCGIAIDTQRILLIRAIN